MDSSRISNRSFSWSSPIGKNLNQKGVQGDRVTANFQQITSISQLPDHQRKNVTKLFLSHNKLRDLLGIEQYHNLTHLSLSYNSIDSLRELQRVKMPEKLVALSIKGNPISTHPNITAEVR